MLAGLTGGAELDVESVTSNQYKFPEPRRFGHFIHGGELVSARPSEDDPPFGLFQGVGTYRGRNPLTLTGEASASSSFAAPLRLPQGAQLRRIFMYFDTAFGGDIPPAGDVFVRIGDLETEFKLTLNQAPLIPGQPEDASQPIFTYEMPLEHIEAGSLHVRIPPQNYIFSLSNFHHVVRLEVDVDLTKAKPIDNLEQFYALRINWPNRLKEQNGRVWGMSNGLYGILVEYDLEELQP